jgi:hypothetical protein
MGDWPQTTTSFTSKKNHLYPEAKENPKPDEKMQKWRRSEEARKRNG